MQIVYILKKFFLVLLCASLLSLLSSCSLVKGVFDAVLWLPKQAVYAVSNYSFKRREQKDLSREPRRRPIQNPTASPAPAPIANQSHIKNGPYGSVQSPQYGHTRGGGYPPQQQYGGGAQFNQGQGGGFPPQNPHQNSAYTGGVGGGAPDGGFPGGGDFGAPSEFGGAGFGGGFPEPPRRPWWKRLLGLKHQEEPQRLIVRYDTMSMEAVVPVLQEDEVSNNPTVDRDNMFPLEKYAPKYTSASDGTFPIEELKPKVNSNKLVKVGGVFAPFPKLKDIPQEKPKTVTQEDVQGKIRQLLGEGEESEEKKLLLIEEHKDEVLQNLEKQRVDQDKGTSLRGDDLPPRKKNEPSKARKAKGVKTPPIAKIKKQKRTKKAKVGAIKAASPRPAPVVVPTRNFEPKRSNIIRNRRGSYYSSSRATSGGGTLVRRETIRY